MLFASLVATAVVLASVDPREQVASGYDQAARAPKPPHPPPPPPPPKGPIVLPGTEDPYPKAAATKASVKMHKAKKSKCARARMAKRKHERCTCHPK